MRKIIIDVDPDGTMYLIDNDYFAGIPGTTVKRHRLSNIEPDENGLWAVKFLFEDKIREPRFIRRADALAYELEEAEKLLVKGDIYEWLESILMSTAS